MIGIANVLTKSLHGEQSSDDIRLYRAVKGSLCRMNNRQLKGNDDHNG